MPLDWDPLELFLIGDQAFSLAAGIALSQLSALVILTPWFGWQLVSCIFLLRTARHRLDLRQKLSEAVQKRFGLVEHLLGILGRCLLTWRLNLLSFLFS